MQKSYKTSFIYAFDFHHAKIACPREKLIMHAHRPYENSPAANEPAVTSDKASMVIKINKCRKRSYVQR